MEETTCLTTYKTYKTYKEKLRPTPRQEREPEHVLLRCRRLTTTALEQRVTAWGRCHSSLSRFEQEAELKAIRAAFPEWRMRPSSTMSCKTS